MADLTAADIFGFEQRRAALRSTYANAMAQNTYNQGQAGLGYQTGLRDLTRRFDLMRQQVPGGYAKRGLLNSGIYQRGLENYGIERTNAFTGLEQGYQGQVGNLTLGQHGLENSLATGLALVSSEENARRAELAAQLRGVM